VRNLRHRAARLLAGLATVTGLLAATAAAASAVDAVPGPHLAEVNCTGTDWVEIANPGAEDVSLDGWALTDDSSPAAPFAFGTGDVVPAGGMLVVTASSEPMTGFSFGVACDDHLRLTDASDAVVDEVSLPPGQQPGDSYRRDADGVWGWGPATPGEGPSEDAAAIRAGAPAGLFDPFRLARIEFEVAPADLAALCVQPREYVDAVLRLRTPSARFMPYRVGLRLKGNASYRDLQTCTGPGTTPGKAAFRVKFHHSVSGQRFFGVRGLTLNNMVQDRSKIAEAVTSHLAREAGVPTARVGYARVGVNGLTYGLYADVETVDQVMVGRWFPSTAHIYDHDDYGVDVVAADIARFEVDFGDEDDRSDLEALVAAVAGPAEGWSERVAPLADLGRLTAAFALEHYAHHWDGYSVRDSYANPNNYYLHADKAGMFSLIPSGTDQTWRNEQSPGRVGRGVLMRGCVADDACRALYVDAVAAVAERASQLDLPGYARALATSLAGEVALDPFTDSLAVADGVAYAVWLMERRPAAVGAWLVDPAFTWPVLAPPPAGGEPPPPPVDDRTDPGKVDTPPPPPLPPPVPQSDTTPPPAAAPSHLVVTGRVATPRGLVRLAWRVRVPRRGMPPAAVRVAPVARRSGLDPVYARALAADIGLRAARRLNVTAAAGAPWALRRGLRWRAVAGAGAVRLLPLAAGERLAVPACTARGTRARAMTRFGYRLRLTRGRCR
jgi:hypothetical protein